MDESARFPTESVEALRRDGLLGLGVGPDHGGPGGGPLEVVLAIEQVAGACASTGMVYAMHVAATQTLLAGTSDGGVKAQTARMIAAGEHVSMLAYSERGSRGHFWAQISRAVANDGGVRFDADKSWATSAGHVDSYVTAVGAPGTDDPMTTELYLVDAHAGHRDPVLLRRARHARQRVGAAQLPVGPGRGRPPARRVYLRGEYPEVWERLVHAVAQARARGFLGENILGRGVCFDIELRKGAGAYICGEETSLFNSLEGYRGEPRNKPPFPVDVGVFGKPTVINNVETLVNVPAIVLEGGRAYAEIGTPDSTGTRLFCLSGRVARPGIYEAPFGVTLRELLELGGGVMDGRPLRAILLGGAAGKFATPDELDVEMSFEATRQARVTMGSGVVMVIDDTVDIHAILMQLAAFFRDESCGQCVPCRVGTVRQEEALARLVNGRPRGSVEQEYRLLDEITASMRDASICGLGQTAADAIESALRKLDLFENGARP